MENINVYDVHAKHYDKWFDDHHNWYMSEVTAIKKAIPENARGIEVGIGSGRFAKALGIAEGIEPSESMAALGRERGLSIKIGVVEALPYPDGSIDFVLMVTVDCFLNDLAKAFQEIYRVLKSGGKLIIGMIDKSSPLGILYETKKKDNIFYCNATFHDVDEMTNELRKANFHQFNYWQTLLNISQENYEEPQQGYGKGGFAVISAVK
ncbi:MAG: class I SAM-dependent methyltransferase [Cyclobacteriaceae bacterium]